jgi:hypothetical protein
MTTKLEAINIMLSCIGHNSINSLESTKSSFITSAENILDAETKRLQLQSYDFNTEDNYPLNPDVDGIIKIPDSVVSVAYPQEYLNRYTIRDGKLYDKHDHTFKIKHPIRASVTFALEFEELPEVVRYYIAILSAYKFTKREFGSQAVCVYTQEDVEEARQAFLESELDLGNYSLISEFYTREIKGDL